MIKMFPNNQDSFGIPTKFRLKNKNISPKVSFLDPLHSDLNNVVSILILKGEVTVCVIYTRASTHFDAILGRTLKAINVRFSRESKARFLPARCISFG